MTRVSFLKTFLYCDRFLPWHLTADMQLLYGRMFLPGPSRRLAPVLKCRQFLSFFQRYIVRDISLAHWNLIRHSEKHEAWRKVKRKIIAFWGRTRSPTFTMHQFFKSEYLERQIYERSLKSEPSIVKFIKGTQRGYRSKQLSIALLNVF